MNSPFTFTPRDPMRCLLFGLIIWLSLPKSGRAESSLTFKNQTWQEEDHRIRVDSQYALIESDLTTGTHFKLMGLIDSIAGATPTGEKPATASAPVPLANMEDRRKAWDAELSHQFARVAVTAGFANSRESDYVSNSWSLNTVTDFNEKNTSLLLGFGHTDDRINEEKLGWTIKRPKTGDDFLVGVNQLIDANTVLTANLSFGRSRGFMSDPYKIVSTTMLDLDPGAYYTVPENRPEKRNKVVLFLGLNRNFDRWHGALEGSYRYYHDTFGINSHMLALLWLQKLGAHVTLQPSLRLYRQSAADFYYVDLDQAGIVTSYEPLLGETGTGRAPFYSSDYRLSHMQTVDVGLKVVWKIRPWLEVDAACNRYVMRGLDHVTPSDAYNRANTFTVGIKLTR
ncbi:MAG: DUF3570 domain-containing protein [Opitutae bacterium]|nr:DUF3570 domain-containing protein [Opitutae bacterium]